MDTWAPISLERCYSYHTANVQVWYPGFIRRFAYLQPIYNKSTNYREFEIDSIEEAMEYVDQFLIRMSNLKAFI